ncbi:uncharacterized protein [Hetaerina americana]|uniref:uncharacterized protein n=1 Tax=Hetaerina americana TaxID=62018 RepID=UPI003A7F4875
MERLSTAEEYYSAYSVPVDSDDGSSDCGGYETAYDEGRNSVISGSDSPVDESRRGSESSVVDIGKSSADVDSKKAGLKKVFHILQALNDCMWCTNVFTTERLKGRNPKRRTSMCCNGFPKFLEILYTDEDIRKELEYIQYLLHVLLKELLPMMSTKGSGPIYDNAMNVFDKMPSLQSASNGWSVHRFSQTSIRCNEKTAELNKLLNKGPRLFFDEKELNVMLRKILMEAEAADSISKYGRGISVEGKTGVIGREIERADSDGTLDYECEAAARMEACSEALDSLKYLFHGEEVAKEMEGCPDPMIVAPLKHSMDWDRDLSGLSLVVNQKVKLVNFFLGIVRREDENLEIAARVFEKEAEAVRENMREEVGVRRTTGDSGWDSSKMLRGSWNPWSPSLDQLLFEKEKWRLGTVELNGGDPLAHLCGVALPLDYASFKNDTRATYYGIKRKNMLSIALQTADMSEKIQKSFPKKIFDLMMLLLSMALYFSDMISDLILAGDHFSQGNKVYSYLTITFVFAPFISETLSKFILKSLGWDREYGRLQWKDVFNFNDFKIIKWMCCSVNYSLKSMKDYRHLAPCHAVLHSHRCDKGKRNFTVGREEVVDSTHIYHVFYSMLAWNERFTLQTKLAESLNESAPQLLLQLVIVFKQYVSGNKIGFKTWFCIVTSTLSLSWSMHLSHFNRHYHTGGRVLHNAYEWKARILEFFGNCFVYGSRFLCISLVASFHGVWFVLGALLYLTAIYFVMIFASGRKEIYKTLHRYKTTIFWPLHRLFTVPYRIGVWRMDSLDHLLYYSEIAFLALLTPFVLPQEADQGVAWVATGVFLSFAGVGAGLLYAFKRCVHPYGYICENR